MWTRRTLFLLTACAGLAALTAFSELVNARDAKAHPRPSSAVILFEEPAGRDGVGELKAIRLTDPKKLILLESFFPDYRKRPDSDDAAAWEAAYRIYFDFPNGEALRVSVSRNDQAGRWSVGRGDFRTKGDFTRFIADLVSRRSDLPK
jgi:hypothetical protein